MSEFIKIIIKEGQDGSVIRFINPNHIITIKLIEVSEINWNVEIYLSEVETILIHSNTSLYSLNDLKDLLGIS